MTDTNCAFDLGYRAYMNDRDTGIRLTENPYSWNDEKALHEAWEDGYQAVIETTIDHIILNGAKLHLEHGEDPHVTNSAELAECIVETLRKNGVVIMMQKEFDKAVDEAFTRGQLSTLPD